MMKISILVPIYGVEKHIEECAVSLFSQSYQDLEYIFVDDCSPDYSIEVLKNVLRRFPEREQQVTIIRHEHNRGLGAARKTALTSATGEFVMVVDSDDVVMTDAVEKLYKQQQQTGADIVDGAFCRLTLQGKKPAMLPYHGKKESMLRLILLQNTLPHQLWARLVRRSLYTENDINSIEGVNMAEDYAVMPRLLFCGTRTYIDDVVYLYRDSDTSSFKSNIAPIESRHVGSLIDANTAVFDFFRTRDTKRQYSLPMQIGLLKVYYMSRQYAGMTADEVDKRGGFILRNKVIKWCRTFLDNAPNQMRLAYLVLKWFYKNFLLFSDKLQTLVEDGCVQQTDDNKIKRGSNDNTHQQKHP